ncbi:hypothetical protein [Paenibacillus sp. TC-CSREp1]|uniref:hypothetical protein n=1 Tax=Paenibacillus sp. TC-CSREp1 TaxID=3410089 RepID=UPI003CEF5FC6
MDDKLLRRLMVLSAMYRVSVEDGVSIRDKEEDEIMRYVGAALPSLHLKPKPELNALARRAFVELLTEVRAEMRDAGYGV